MRKIIYSIFMFVGIMASLLGVNESNAQINDHVVHKNGNQLKAEQQNNLLYFSDVLKRQNNGTFIAAHYSHESHGSHRSHYSSRY